MVWGLKVGDLCGLSENPQLRVLMVAALPHSLPRKLGKSQKSTIFRAKNTCVIFWGLNFFSLPFSLHPKFNLLLEKLLFSLKKPKPNPRECKG